MFNTNIHGESGSYFHDESYHIKHNIHIIHSIHSTHSNHRIHHIHSVHHNKLSNPRIHINNNIHSTQKKSLIPTFFAVTTVNLASTSVQKFNVKRERCRQKQTNHPHLSRSLDPEPPFVFSPNHPRPPSVFPS